MNDRGHINPTQRRIARCVGLAAFLFQFEAGFVQVSLPDMQCELGCTAEDIARVMTLYLLGAVLTLLPAGALGRRLGFARTFVAGCALLLGATVLCGLAGSLQVLLVCRALQGASVALMVSAGYTLIPLWLDERHLGWGFSMVSLGAAVGMVAGLPVGGLVAHHMDWPWVFLLQAPLMLGVLLFALHALPADPQRDKTTRPWRDTLLGLSGSRLFVYCLFTLFAFQLLAGGARYLAPFYLESVLRLTSAESGLWMLLLALGVALGLAAGLFSSPNNRLMMSGVPREFERDVGSLLAVSLNTGTMAGVFVFDRAVHALAPVQGNGERTSTAVDLFAAYPTVYWVAGASFLFMACLHLLMSRLRTED